MSIWALVPVKPFLQSKTRLAPVLSPEARAELSRELLRHTLRVLADAPAIDHTLVISRDPSAWVVARECGAEPVAEPNESDLNLALTRATDLATAGGAGAVLAVPSDLPFLSVEDVLKLVYTGPDPTIRVVPDRHDVGTNALFIRPPGLIPYSFGAESFRRHLELAAHVDVPARICRLSGLALDVDTPNDLRLLRMTQKI